MIENQVKIISVDQLDSVDPENECFIIKNCVEEGVCKDILKFLNDFKKNKENERVDGENWHYHVTSNGNFFDSFIFNELGNIKNQSIVGAYRKLFEIYNKLGERTESNNFDSEIYNNTYNTNYKIINPLVFWYYNEKSQFGFHKHDIRNQKFQLLLNLTSPGFDYLRGETLVYLNSGRPNINDVNLRNQCCVFGEAFKAGDIFSFPYHLWHKVEMPTHTQKLGVGARVSLLMPLARRNADEYKNEVL